MGMNTMAPMNASYSLAIARIDFHKPSRFITGRNAIAIWRQKEKQKRLASALYDLHLKQLVDSKNEVTL